MKVPPMVSVGNYFSNPTPPHTVGSIIRWWEGRRLLYNAVVLAEIFLVSAVLGFLRFGIAEFESLQLFGYVFLLPLGVGLVLIQIPANLWYTFGWIAEISLRKTWRNMPDEFGSWAQRIGLGFSILFTFVVMVLLWWWFGL
jgi:hypothetical protein